MIEKYEDILSSATLAFSGQRYDIALDYAKKAMKMEPKNPAGYFTAGKICMSDEKLSDAIDYLKTAVELDKKNGNGYFLYGYACVMAGQFADAVRGFTRALENNCTDELKGQIYRTISLVDIEKGDYESAVSNLKQAEKYLGADTELLRQQATCYASMKDYKKTLFVLNQIKLLQPKNYNAYSLAFHIFLELGIYDEAKAELERAEEFADLDIDYYSDRVAYSITQTIENETPEQEKERLYNTILSIDMALKKGKPNAQQAFEMYCRAAQLYLSLNDAEQTLKCLNAAGDTVQSFNSGFSVVKDMSSNSEQIPDEEQTQEEYTKEEQDFIDEFGLDAFYAASVQNDMEYYMSSEDDEVVSDDARYLTPLDSIPDKKATEEKYVIDEPFQINPIDKDLLTSLYLSVYELQGDYDNMLQKAKILQSSTVVSNQYTGIYYELKIGKYRNEEKWEIKYRDRINFWTKRLIEDPSDVLSASFRIRSYIDIGELDRAEQLTACLPDNIRDTLAKVIEQAKKKG